MTEVDASVDFQIQALRTLTAASAALLSTVATVHEPQLPPTPLISSELRASNCF